MFLIPSTLGLSPTRHLESLNVTHVLHMEFYMQKNTNLNANLEFATRACRSNTRPANAVTR